VSAHLNVGGGMAVKRMLRTVWAGQMHRPESPFASPEPD